MTQSKHARRGYLATVFGGICGAILAVAIAIPVIKLSVSLGILNSGQLTLQFFILLLVAASFGNTLGCWLALYLGRYPFAKRTTTILIGLLIPSWFLYLVISLFTSLELLLAIALLVILPLLARHLTYDPNFPDYLFRAVHVNAKRP